MRLLKAGAGNAVGSFSPNVRQVSMNVHFGELIYPVHMYHDDSPYRIIYDLTCKSSERVSSTSYSLANVFLLFSPFAYSIVQKRSCFHVLPHARDCAVEPNRAARLPAWQQIEPNLFLSEKNRRAIRRAQNPS